MKAIFISLLGLLTVTSALAESPYRIDLVGTGKQYLFVDHSWQRTAECVEVKFSVAQDIQGGELAMKAYFYSADGKLVETMDKPSSQANGDGGTMKAPSEYKSGKKYEVYFGIPDSIKSGEKKWKRVIVVTGKGDYMSAKIYPKDDLAKFDFPEKAFVK